MFHYRVPGPWPLRMAANVLLDVGIGTIPFVGDAFDIFFKANTRNLNLLRARSSKHVLDGDVYSSHLVAALLISCSSPESSSSS